MAIESQKNEYQGVNAHLHSHFQNTGDWTGFHESYIVDLARNITSILPAGYVVDLEKSLQIKEYHPDSGEKIKRPEPDVAIYQRTSSTGLSALPFSSVAATLNIPVIETFPENADLYLTALTIYRTQPDSILGIPVTQIEILSPTNKLSGEGYLQYIDKRQLVLKSGLILVEVDYMHESDSPLKGIPSYSRRHPNAYAYRISVSNPRPGLEEGRTLVYGFHVDEKIPAIPVPLAGEERIEVDFGKVYNQTFESLPAYSLRVDYEQLPKNFDSYSDFDKAQILRVMERVKAKKSD